MRLAVLMTCHNRVETTLSCLSRLMPQLKDGGQVFLVDDGSSDGTGARIRAEFPVVSVIDADGSLYWAKGMHLAWSIAIKSGRSFDFFLWLNDDVALKSDAISRMMSDWTSCGNEKAVLVGACSVDEQESACSYGVSDLSGNKILPNRQSVQRVSGWFNGNVVLVPFATYESVGMISDDYTHARADYDYAERLKRVGVPFFCSSQYAGVCRNDFPRKMQDVGLWQRIRMLWNPGSLNMSDLWKFRVRYYGYGRAILSCLHLAVLVIKGVE